MTLTPEEIAVKYIKPKNPNCAMEAQLIEKIRVEAAMKIRAWAVKEYVKPE